MLPRHSPRQLMSVRVTACRNHTHYCHSFIQVTILLTDVNDNKPVFQMNEFFTSTNHYAHNVLENATIGTTVLRVYALDDDTGANGEVSYAILGQGTIRLLLHCMHRLTTDSIQAVCLLSIQLPGTLLLLVLSTLRTSLKSTSLW